jgi:membrane-anchored protein YejM (alkaline phosphatase superfamily)
MEFREIPDPLFPKVWTEQRLTQNHVPLLYYSPELIQPAKHHRIASQIDLLPTLAGICKIPYTNYSLGRDLLDTLNSKQFAFLFGDNNQASIIDSQYLYRRQINGGKEEFFSLLGNDQIPKIPPLK